EMEFVFGEAPPTSLVGSSENQPISQDSEITPIKSIKNEFKLTHVSVKGEVQLVDVPQKDICKKVLIVSCKFIMWKKGLNPAEQDIGYDIQQNENEKANWYPIPLIREVKEVPLACLVSPAQPRFQVDSVTQNQIRTEVGRRQQNRVESLEVVGSVGSSGFVVVEHKNF
ncbi:hypothetical protein R6Q57_028463, partial [Mikania cordata]